MNVEKPEKVAIKDNQPFRISIKKISRYPIHWHENVTEIILPIWGDVEVTASFERLTVTEGDFHFINNKTIHSISSSSNALVALFHINLPLFEKDFEYIKYMFFRTNPYIDDKQPNIYLNDLKKINYKDRFRNLLIVILLKLLSYDLPEDKLNALGNQLVYTMVVEFNWLRFIESNDDIINSEQFDRYHRIVKFIDENYMDKITLDDIVASEFITKTYFSYYWKRFSSYSFTERVNYERVLKSEFLLLTDANITSISEQCGFSDVKYYYKYFKRWFGCMPLEHRQSCLEYNELGTDVEMLDLDICENELKEYANKYLSIECNPKGSVADSTYIDSYMKMRMLSNPSNLKTSAEKSIVLNLFKPSSFQSGENGNDIYNWYNIDLSVNAAIDIGVPLCIVFSLDDIDRNIVDNAIGPFINGSISRYGLPKVKKWHFFINSNNVLTFDKADNIEKLILSKVKGAKIVYTFEF